MELEVKSIIWIDIDEIINRGKLTSNSKPVEVRDAIVDWCEGLDDCDYYMIGSEEIAKIRDKILNRIGEQTILTGF